MKLTEFLLARIAEDEGNAADCNGVAGCDVPDVLIARALADCVAKRQIVGLHSGPQYGRPDAHLCEDSMTPDDECETLRALASPYADHPDYREEWKP